MYCNIMHPHIAGVVFQLTSELLYVANIESSYLNQYKHYIIDLSL